MAPTTRVKASRKEDNGSKHPVERRLPWTERSIAAWGLILSIVTIIGGLFAIAWAGGRQVESLVQTDEVLARRVSRTELAFKDHSDESTYKVMAEDFVPRREVEDKYKALNEKIDEVLIVVKGL